MNVPANTLLGETCCSLRTNKTLIKKTVVASSLAGTGNLLRGKKKPLVSVSLVHVCRQCDHFGDACTNALSLNRSFIHPLTFPPALSVSHLHICPHTHTHTHTLSLTYTHARTHTRNTYGHSGTHSHGFARTFPRSHPLSHTHSATPTQPHPLSHSHSATPNQSHP